MKMKPNTYLVETSAVPAAVGRTTSSHRRKLEETTEGARLASSTYIRKEWLRRWFVDYVYAAQVFEASRSVEDAWRLLAQRFSGRERAVYLNLLADLNLCRDHAADPANTRQVARKIAELALQLVWDFDDLFGLRITNASCCKIGDLQPPLDGNRLLASLAEFCQVFCEPVTNCEVNGFLDFANDKSTIRTIIDSELVARNKKFAEPLTTFQRNRVHITCRECGRIGDAIITAEHAAQVDADDYCLLHVDNAFDRYCDSLNIKHQKLPAPMAIEGVPRHPGA